MSAKIDRPDQILSDNEDGIAAETWQAYNAMETTKHRHFSFLEILDQKKKNFNLDPTETDKLRLECLLKDHDEQVKRFTRASDALKARDAGAHAALFAYMAAISVELTARVTH